MLIGSACGTRSTPTGTRGTRTVALTDAMDALGVERDRIRLLSVGTGSYPGRRRAGSRGPAVVRTERLDSAIALGVSSVGDAARPPGGTGGCRTPRSVGGHVPAAVRRS